MLFGDPVLIQIYISEGSVDMKVNCLFIDNVYTDFHLGYIEGNKILAVKNGECREMEECVDAFILGGIPFDREDDSYMLHPDKYPDYDSSMHLWTLFPFAVLVSDEGYQDIPDEICSKIARTGRVDLNAYPDIKPCLRWGMVEFLTAEVKLEPIYEDMGECFYHGIIPVRKDGKWGFMDKEFEYALYTEYLSVGGWNDEAIAVMGDNNNWAIAKPYIGTITDFIFEERLDFEWSDIVRARVNGKYGYVNGNGDFVIPPIYDYLEDGLFVFDNSSAIGVQNGKFCVLDRNNEYILPPEYHEILYDNGTYDRWDSEMLIVSREEGVWQVADLSGRLLTSELTDDGIVQFFRSLEDFPGM